MQLTTPQIFSNQQQRILDARTLDCSNRQAAVLLGNEAIVRGALESGVRFVAAYPGTPSSEIIDRFSQLGDEAGIYVEYSVNEKVSMEVSCAAAICGVRSLCSMKHVGLNVAADAFMTLAYVGVKAGMVIVVADDPFASFQPERTG